MQRRPFLVGLVGVLDIASSILSAVVLVIAYFSYAISEAVFIISEAWCMVHYAIGVDTLRGEKWARVAQIVMPCVGMVANIVLGNIAVTIVALPICIPIVLYFWGNKRVIEYFQRESVGAGAGSQQVRSQATATLSTTGSHQQIQTPELLDRAPLGDGPMPQDRKAC